MMLFVVSRCVSVFAGGAAIAVLPRGGGRQEGSGLLFFLCRCVLNDVFFWFLSVCFGFLAKIWTFVTRLARTPAQGKTPPETNLHFCLAQPLSSWTV